MGCGGGLLPSQTVHLPCRHVLALRCAGLVAVLLTAACSQAPTAKTTTDADWHDFQGTWTAAGSRNTLHLDGNRFASIATFSGSLVLAGPSRPDIGFRSEAVVFNDTATGLVGRAVWTDEHGDQAFSELRGQGTSKENKIMGIFVGGTGRYARAAGTYEFSWRFLIENEDGIVQGESIGLNGRLKVNSPT